MNTIIPVPTPCYIIDESQLVQNLEILANIIRRTGCKILLAQKAFSLYDLYPLIGQYLDGTSASGLYEARLGAEAMGKENHVFCPAYQESTFDEIVSLCGHIIFNSFNQLKQFRKKALGAGRLIGLRINPMYSTQPDHPIYDPCATGSRLGVTLENFDQDELDGVSGLHFHTLCEQNSDALEETLTAVERQFDPWLGRMSWLNFGGGHHITRPDYDIDRLERCVQRIQDRYGVQVYLEPGEAIALNAGFLAATVVDLVRNGMDIAILDASAACHAPDVLEMPYRPMATNSGLPEEKAYTYRLGGPTCLAGDVFGDYSFDKPLLVGNQLTFEDMAIYSIVKNNTFNGMPLPTIAFRRKSGEIEIIRQFGYHDFKDRLGSKGPSND